ncbi:MAG: sensor histidine kinase [Armatimonadota bacterium]
MTSEISLTAWRRRATDVLLSVSAIVLLPVVVLALLGFGFPGTWWFKVSGLAAYLTIAAGMLARRVDYRMRVWLLVGAGYLVALLGIAAFPERPFFRAMPIMEALIALVLVGARSARIVTLASVGIYLFASVLHVTPGVAHLLVEQGSYTRTPTSHLVMQFVSMTALLIGIMVLLERFHLVLLQALAAQQLATDSLRQETAQRENALRKLEREIDERQRLERELARIGDDERRRFGQDMHDGVCQQLTGALLRCQALERRLVRGDPLPPADLRALSTLLEEAIDEAHNIAQGLQPLEPEPGALAQALRTLAKRTQATGTLRCRFVATGEAEVPDPALAQHLHRIAQEAVSNAVRHAGAGQILITLQGEADAVVLQVQDDGVGLPEALPTGGMGMRTMAFRAQIVGGTLTVEPAPDGGLRVVCRAPLPRNATRSTVMVGGERNDVQ